MNFEELTQKELYYIEKAKEIGGKKGDSKELQDLCRQAYSDYQEKIISSKAYGKIYAICVDYAYRGRSKEESIMKIGAYQFAIAKNINENMEKIKKAICEASKESVRLLAFPECALTGYPPHDIKNPAAVDFVELERAYEELQKLSNKNNMYLIIGSIIQKDDKFYNSAVLFSPNKEKQYYHKKALWGWDKDNFAIGDEEGVFDIDGLRVGIRICYEVRFPEFFRELYRKSTDLNVILFYDVADFDHKERYEVIKGHIVTRAVENVTHTLSVDTIHPYQTAPTALYDKSGYGLVELERNKEGLLVYDLKIESANFGEQGRIEISDWLMGNRDMGTRSEDKKKEY